MKKYIYLLLTVLSLSLLVISCTPDANEDLIDHSIDESYYQLGQVGTYWEYKLDSLIFDNGGATQLLRTGYIRINVVDIETKSNGDIIHTMQLNRRETPDQSWIEDRLYRVEKNIAGEIFVIIDNLVFREFSFPFNEGSTWESILFDTDQLYEFVEGEMLEKYNRWDSSIVLNRDTTIIVGGTTYESVATIQEVDSEILTELRQSIAYYAAGVGVIQRQRSILDSQCINVNPDCEFDPWLEKAEKGYIVSQSLLDYSIE